MADEKKNYRNSDRRVMDLVDDMTENPKLNFSQYQNALNEIIAKYPISPETQAFGWRHLRVKMEEKFGLSSLNKFVD